jgi:hypothetical protein
VHSSKAQRIGGSHKEKTSPKHRVVDLPWGSRLLQEFTGTVGSPVSCSGECEDVQGSREGGQG